MKVRKANQPMLENRMGKLQHKIDEMYKTVGCMYRWMEDLDRELDIWKNNTIDKVINNHQDALEKLKTTDGGECGTEDSSVGKNGER